MGEDGIRNLRRQAKINPNASMTQESLRALAPVLKTTVAWLIAEEGSEELENSDGVPPPQLDVVEPTAALSTTSLRSLPRDLPVLGTAAGSFAVERGGFEMESRVIEYVRRPEALLSVVDAYAIYMTGNSMAPEHNEGDLRIVHPSRPPRIGDSVVIQVKSSPSEPVVGYVARLVRRSGERIIVAKHNPAKEVEFDSKYVVSIHRILTLNELLGL